MRQCAKVAALRVEECMHPIILRFRCSHPRQSSIQSLRACCIRMHGESGAAPCMRLSPRMWTDKGTQTDRQSNRKPGREGSEARWSSGHESASNKSILLD